MLYDHSRYLTALVKNVTALELEFTGNMTVMVVS